ncbi:hypothetical protein ACFVVM_33010 [Nocardia sp. NPDC058176]|uniref:hypothetical protein n=1 Tax=Nocardia sp. NPDC058176 TaxID=3346368 RepID=UPI0036DBB0CA
MPVTDTTRAPVRRWRGQASVHGRLGKIGVFIAAVGIAYIVMAFVGPTLFPTLIWPHFFYGTAFFGIGAMLMVTAGYEQQHRGGRR